MAATIPWRQVRVDMIAEIEYNEGMRLVTVVRAQPEGVLATSQTLFPKGKGASSSRQRDSRLYGS